jgi:hypothetical protein
VESSRAAIQQRRPGSAPAVRARPDALPLADGACDAALALLTIQHWPKWRDGVTEMCRVASDRVVILTWDPDEGGFWLLSDYMPDLLAASRKQFPRIEEVVAALGGDAQVLRVPIPHDCTDGFLGAYWRRPSLYLDPAVRRGISSVAADMAFPPLERLQQELTSGHWDSKYKHLLAEESLDIGYRIVVGRRES